MTTNPELAKGHAAAEICADHAGEEFKEAAYDTFVFACKHWQYVRTSKVIKDLYDGPEPHDSRAWGAIARRALKEKIIEPCGRTSRTGSHGCYNNVWKSLIFEG